MRLTSRGPVVDSPLSIVATSPDGTKRPATKAEASLIQTGCLLGIVRLAIAGYLVVAAVNDQSVPSLILILAALFVSGLSIKWRE